MAKPLLGIEPARMQFIEHEPGYDECAADESGGADAWQSSVDDNVRVHEQRLLDDARILEQAGAGMIVLEAIPAALASQVTAAAKVPTIGIGAGVDCHGQVLVLHDMLDVYPGKKAKFVKNYMKAAAGSIQDAVALYVAEVRAGKFPGREHSF